VDDGQHESWPEIVLGKSNCRRSAIHPIPVRLEQEFDRCLFGLCVKCRGSHCGIQAEPAFMLRTWCQQHAPQLTEFVRLSSDRRLRTLLDGSDMAPITPFVELIPTGNSEGLGNSGVRAIFPTEHVDLATVRRNTPSSLK
jgi:hypothetical protein